MRTRRFPLQLQLGDPEDGAFSSGHITAAGKPRASSSTHDEAARRFATPAAGHGRGHGAKVAEGNARSTNGGDHWRRDFRSMLTPMQRRRNGSDRTRTKLCVAVTMANPAVVFLFAEPHDSC